ncbi:MAG TPA: hypothetical protein VF092_27995 [Longimicrobium sp.]
MRRFALGLLLLPVLAGCRTEADAKPGTATRDSAGVRIVEHHGGESEIAWRVADRPELDLTGAEAGKGPGLYQVMGAVRLGDGRIVVANGGTSTLEIFGADGAHQRSVGRAGDGPGEFRALSWVGRFAGDSIAAWDSGTGRLSVFTPAGDFARSVAPAQPLGIFPRAEGALDGGALLLALHQPSLGMSATEGVHVQRDTISLAVLRPDGAVAVLGRFPGSEVLASGNPAGGLMMMPLPFGRATIAAGSGGRVYVADGDRWEIAEYAPGGGVRALVRADRELQPVTPADVRAYRERLVTLGAENNGAIARQHARMLDRAPYPKQKPAITGLLVDAHGNLWVESPESGEGTLARGWTIVSPDGRMLGRARKPDALTVHQVGDGWLIGTATDGEIEHVRLYRITPTH